MAAVPPQRYGCREAGRWAMSRGILWLSYSFYNIWETTSRGVILLHQLLILNHHIASNSPQSSPNKPVTPTPALLSHVCCPARCFSPLHQQLIDRTGPGHGLHWTSPWPWPHRGSFLKRCLKKQHDMQYTITVARSGSLRAHATIFQLSSIRNR